MFFKLQQLNFNLVSLLYALIFAFVLHDFHYHVLLGRLRLIIKHIYINSLHSVPRGGKRMIFDLKSRC